MSHQVDPQSFRARLATLETVRQHALANTGAPKGKELDTKINNCRAVWDRVEEIIDTLYQHFGIKIDPKRKDDGSHSWHEELIDRLDKKETPKEMRDTLGTGLVSTTLLMCKDFRNKYLKDGAKEKPQMADLDHFLQGVKLVIPALEKACTAAKVMDTKMPT
jgi:hypothetical protein